MTFYTDSLVLTYTSVEAAKQWWIDSFACKVEKVPAEWDNPLPSDVALKFPQDKEPTILLCAQSEVEEAKLDSPSAVVSTIFCDNLKKAHELLSTRRILVGPVQDGGDTQYFEIRDIQGHLIQVCLRELEQCGWRRGF
jgi:hypothetical protein